MFQWEVTLVIWWTLQKQSKIKLFWFEYYNYAIDGIFKLKTEMFKMNGFSITIVRGVSLTIDIKTVLAHTNLA